MKTVLRFVAGIALGIVVPLGSLLGWIYISGEDPAILMSGEMSDPERTEMLNAVQRAIDKSGRWIASWDVADAIKGIEWVDEVAVWRTVTNSLYVHLESKKHPSTSVIENTKSTIVGDQVSPSEDRPRLDSQTLLAIQSIAKSHGDEFDHSQHTSEGFRIALKSGASVLLGKKDYAARLQRFFVVLQSISTASDPSLMVVDARYDHGVAIARREPNEVPSFESDSEVTDSPVVLTHE